MKAAVAVVLGAAACVAVAACGGARQPTLSAPPVAPSGPGELPANPHDRIDALDREIADALARAQIAPPSVAECAGASCSVALSQPPPLDEPVCRPASSDRCTDTCTLATSICSNQDKICELAKQLSGDDWAANKCQRAKASCRAAQDRCCSCAG